MSLRVSSLVLLAAFAVLAACSRSDQQPSADTPSSAAATTPREVTIVATDFAFQVPDTIEGGMVTLKLVNQGQTYHHVQLVRLLDGKTYNDLVEGLKQMQPGAPPPPWIEDVVGPNSPETNGESRLIREMTPGNYALICFIDTPDKVPHFVKGMTKSLTVVAPTGPVAAAPTADVTVQMSDYAWAISPALTAGKHVLRLENVAEQSHEMFILKLDEGKTKADLLAWGASMQGRMPGTAIGGTSGQRKGDVVYLPVDLAPGNYLLLCFLPDAKDGKMHLEHGMMQELTIS
jgi:hypothetical protein